MCKFAANITSNLFTTIQSATEVSEKIATRQMSFKLRRTDGGVRTSNFLIPFFSEIADKILGSNGKCAETRAAAIVVDLPRSLSSCLCNHQRGAGGKGSSGELAQSSELKRVF